jgi:hypothetical protein
MKRAEDNTGRARDEHKTGHMTEVPIAIENHLNRSKIICFLGLGAQ